MIYCAVTSVLFLAYYLVGSALDTMRPGERVMMASLLSCAQVVVTELLLGLGGGLTLVNVAAVNIIISCLVIVAVRHYGPGRIRDSFGWESHSFGSAIRESLDPFNLLLTALLVAAYSWIVLGAWFLPPRGGDDLVYHLPPLFEYFQSHTIKLLPVEIRAQFAFPQNAELLYLWQVLFAQTERMVDCVNVPFALLSIVVVHVFARRYGMNRKDALFISLLYPLSPVVLMQAGTNYIEIMTALFFLTGLYFTVVFLEERKSIHLYLAGVAIGLLCGMKYTALFLTLPLQILIMLRLRADRRPGGIRFYAIILLLGGWWYVRNAVVLGAPFYPLNPFAPGLHWISGSREGGILRDVFLNAGNWIRNYPQEDIGIGSLDGGFGLVFWGLAFPSWLYLAGYSIVRFRVTAWTRLLVLMQLPIGFLMLLPASRLDIPFVNRLAMFVIPIGLLAFGSVLTIIDDRFYKALLKSAAIIFSGAAVCLMSVSTVPTYRFDAAWADREVSWRPSEFKYADSRFSPIWEPLDYLTRDGVKGARCYLAATKGLFMMAPIYGSRLQNRIVNLFGSGEQSADAFIYIRFPENDIFGRNDNRTFYFLNYKVDMQDLIAGKDHVVVTQSDYGCLIVSRSFLSGPARLDLLRTYYRETWPDMVPPAARLAPFLREGVPLITSSPIAYGLKYLDMGSSRMDRIVHVPDGEEEDIARKMNVGRYYTLGRPLRGYHYDKVRTGTGNDPAQVLYENHR